MLELIYYTGEVADLNEDMQRRVVEIQCTSARRNDDLPEELGRR